MYEAYFHQNTELKVYLRIPLARKLGSQARQNGANATNA
jgi:hypothetical protein